MTIITQCKHYLMFYINKSIMTLIRLNTYFANNTIDLYKKENSIDENNTENEHIFKKLQKLKYVYNSIYCNYEEHLTNFDEIKIGDTVRISYCTNSQLNMMNEEYQPFVGIVFFIDNLNHNMLIYYDLFDKSSNKFIKIITSLSRPNCSYFGDQRGYSTSIYKLKQISN